MWSVNDGLDAVLDVGDVGGDGSLSVGGVGLDASSAMEGIESEEVMSWTLDIELLVMGFLRFLISDCSPKGNRMPCARNSFQSKFK